MRFVLDEHIAQQVVRFLEYVYGGNGVEWIHVTDLEDAYERAEDQWMLALCGTDSIIVTGDRDQRTRHPDRVIAEAGGRMLILGSWLDNMPVRPRARWFMDHAERLISHGRAMHPGMIWRLDRRCGKAVVFNAGPKT